MAITRKDIPVFSSTLFSWKDKNGCTERSDLGAGPLVTRVYNDACDVGCYIESVRTGKCKLFTLVSQRPTKDCEIECWVLQSVDGKHTVTVYND